MKTIDRKQTRNLKQIRNLDLTIIFSVLCLIATGLVLIVYASSKPYTGDDASMMDLFRSVNLQLAGLQFLWVILGMAGIIVMMTFDYSVFKDLSRPMFMFIVAVLVLLLIIGSSKRGATAWFQFGTGENQRGLQPAEFGKLVLIIVVAKIAGSACDNSGGLVKLQDIGMVLLATGTLVALILAQNDAGTAFVYICIMIGIMFAAKISYKFILAGSVLGAGSFVAAYFFLMEGWQQDRIREFLGTKSDELGSGYNVLHSKLAIGSGQLSGKGVFNNDSIVQLGFLPEQTTDFIFAAGIEAFGFIGGIVILLLYSVLLIRIIYVALRARDHFGTFICVGVASMFIAHIFENIGMVMGVMPVTGIPLPFISYGGSNMLANMLAVGLTLSVSMRRQTKRFRVKARGLA